MSLPFVGLLVFVAIAAYYFSEARRWRLTSEKLEEESSRQTEELDAARRIAIEKESESATTRRLAEAQAALLTKAQEQLEEKFRALAANALHSNSQLFLDHSRNQIQHLIEPVSQSLRRFEEQVQAVERSRIGAYSELSAQVSALTHLQERVRESTEQLKTALRSPIQRGRWGEMQLRRVVELAGMLEYCDFSEQKTLFGETNQRPDLTVRLPNECQVIVDAKVSLEAYLKAAETQDEAERRKYLVDHARQVRTHLKSLGEKAYWERLPRSPEFVVAFLPLESLFSAALEQDPTLIDFGVEKKVLLATPLTLISLLLTVAHGWRQHALAENAERIRETGIELYRRLSTMHAHFGRLGDAIEKSVSAYNETLGSLEKKVLPQARRFQELRPANTDVIATRAEIEAATRKPDPAKWRLASGEAGADLPVS
jgi:DNA recombination protein RmuC